MHHLDHTKLCSDTLLQTFKTTQAWNGSLGLKESSNIEACTYGRRRKYAMHALQPLPMPFRQPANQPTKHANGKALLRCHAV
jgi:hypothetical protein